MQVLLISCNNSFGSSEFGIRRVSFHRRDMSSRIVETLSDAKTITVEIEIRVLSNQNELTLFNILFSSKTITHLRNFKAPASIHQYSGRFDYFVMGISIRLLLNYFFRIFGLRSYGYGNFERNAMIEISLASR